MSTQKPYAVFAFTFAATLFIAMGVSYADIETFDSDLGRFTTFDSSTPSALTAVWDATAGYAGGGMILSNSSGGSEAGVEYYDVSPGTFYMITVWIQVPEVVVSVLPITFEFGIRSGQHSASDFVSNPGSWFIPGQWEYGAVAGDQTKWSETDSDWKVIGMSVYTAPSDSKLSLGFKLIGIDGPDVHIDDVHVTVASAAMTVDFDEDPYDAFDETLHGFGFNGTTGKFCNGVLPTLPGGFRLYCPDWMHYICSDHDIADPEYGTSVREVTRSYSGAAWRLDNPHVWGDGSPVIELTTVPGTVYTCNFWMVRDGGNDAWTNVVEYNCHVAWRLADDPAPGDIEGWPGHIQPNAFHLMCEGTNNVERNYAPDIYAPGTGAAIHCRDLAGSRYSTMAYMAADTSTWFETCIRGLMPQGGDYSEEGPSYWILDDLRLLEHGQEDLIVTTPTPPAFIPIWEFLYR